MSKRKHPVPHPFLPTATAAPAPKAIEPSAVVAPPDVEPVKYEHIFGMPESELKLFRERYLRNERTITYHGHDGSVTHHY